jgi:Resolvase, N terminal domain
MAVDRQSPASVRARWHNRGVTDPHHKQRSEPGATSGSQRVRAAVVVYDRRRPAPVQRDPENIDSSVRTSSVLLSDDRARTGKGDGLIYVRLSPGNRLDGEVARVQAEQMRRFCDEQALTPAQTLVARTDAGGKSARPDFALLEEAIRAKELEWVAIRSWEALSRNAETTEQLIGLFRENEIDLYVAQWGRKVDWPRDRLEVQLVLAGLREMDLVRRRMQMLAQRGKA